MFTVEYRQQVRDFLLEESRLDERISSAAVIGSSAAGEEDRWSDIDLTFGVDELFSVDDVMQDWTKKIAGKFRAVHLFDLQSGSSVYRVLLLDGCLQLDISFTPASKFGATGPNFKLLFGSAVEKPHIKPPSRKDLFGYAIHHIVRAHFCIKRHRYWQAEYWISAARDHLLTLLCIEHGLNPFHGRGYDEIATEKLDLFKDSFVRSPEKDELTRSLRALTDGVLNAPGEWKVLIENVSDKLTQLLD